MENQSIYFFNPQYYFYHLPDETKNNLNLVQIFSSILTEEFNEVRRMNLTSKARLALLQGASLFITTSCYRMTKLMVNKMMDDQEDEKEINWLAGYAIPMVITGTILCGNASRRLIQYYAYSTCFFSQDSQYHDNKITPHIWKSFLELKQENHDLIDLFCFIKSFKNEEDIQEYLREKLEQGACFGYVMAILDQLEKGKNLHGDELLKNIDINTVIKKQLLQHFYFTFNNLLHSQDEVFHDCGDHAIVMLNTNEIIPLSEEREIKRSVIRKASKQFYKLMHLIKGDFRVNIFKSGIEVSKGAEAIKNHFLDEVKRLSFLENEQLDPEEPLKSIHHCFKVEDFMDKEECIANKPVFEQTELVTSVMNLVDHVRRRNKALMAKEAFIKANLVPFPQDTIIAGEISLRTKNNKDHSAHALYFRLSNRKYHLFDPNKVFYELPDFQLFFHKLHTVVSDGYSSNTKIHFTVFSIFQ